MSFRHPLVCIVLAGGLGTRLRSVINDRPKCLAPIGGQPFLEIQVGSLLRQGADRIVLSLGYLSEMVIEAASGFDVEGKVSHIIEPALLGTGGAIAFAMDKLGLDEVLVANGDTYLDGDLSGMLAPLDRGGGELLRMAVVEVPDRTRFGGVVSDAEGWAIKFLPKGENQPGQINAGLYRLCREALPSSPQGATYSLETDVLPRLVGDHHVKVLALEGGFIDIGVPDDYQKLQNRYGR